MARKPRQTAIVTADGSVKGVHNFPIMSGPRSVHDDSSGQVASSQVLVCLVCLIKRVATVDQAVDIEFSGSVEFDHSRKVDSGPSGSVETSPQDPFAAGN